MGTTHTERAARRGDNRTPPTTSQFGTPERCSAAAYPSFPWALRRPFISALFLSSHRGPFSSRDGLDTKHPYCSCRCL
ncbi:hypothetical protein N658DRAFT_499104 [Parathielavia hyrcaniae]|uniref:Uncharacterized protein n=1 Tax=Parathielavia hyrcaniae TaxID=113614 RepID=A0AAN6SZF0_9PEZI|nr:hypothetical protein N658DRAFT_499104 [Parathielavia hyrcaniae]